ncbi:MAG: hypothetical protein GQ544_07675 [Candidatus Aminicenantes bacterium]|nr:hypothetical protein [Candidatus Aminicenantes bacterium]
MFYRLACKVIVCVFFVSLLSLPAFSQWEDVSSFKDVQIPFNLKYKDKIIKKGKYEIEILKHTAQTVYYLRIKKKGKRLCLVPGEYLKYIDEKDIPNKPILRMRRNTAEKLLYVIFESGTITWKYPMIKIRFKIEYED